MPAPIRSTHLECTGGSHFKEYNIQVVPSGTYTQGSVSEPLYNVPFSFGPIGSPSQGGMLNKSGPVTLEQANTLFAKQRSAKLAKQYEESGATDAAIVLTDVRKEKTDWLPQLCNDLDEADLENKLQSGIWSLEEKYDGKRVQAVKDYGEDGIYGINRKGEKVGLPEPVVARLNRIHGRVHLDGELVGLEYISWDILRRQAREFADDVLANRRAALESLHGSEPEAFRLSEYVTGETAKRNLLEALRARKAEGGVFKQIGGTYKPGRPNKGGDWLRYKFWASASCRVLGPEPNGRRSVMLALYNSCPGEWKYAGKVTVPPNFELPAQDSVVEIRYLYARKASGCLYQPIYLGERDDIGWSGCVQSQLKFKAGDEDEEGEG